MANSSNKIVVPNAREAMDRFKMEAAGEVGVSLKQGNNGDISAKQAGSIGGQMVKNVCPARLLRNVQFSRENRVVNGRKTVVKYIVGVAVRDRKTRKPQRFPGFPYTDFGVQTKRYFSLPGGLELHSLDFRRLLRDIVSRKPPSLVSAENIRINYFCSPFLSSTCQGSSKKTIISPNDIDTVSTKMYNTNTDTVSILIVKVTQ